jgi:hypothetical protein
MQIYVKDVLSRGEALDTTTQCSTRESRRWCWSLVSVGWPLGSRLAARRGRGSEFSSLAWTDDRTGLGLVNPLAWRGMPRVAYLDGGTVPAGYLSAF